MSPRGITKTLPEKTTVPENLLMLYEHQVPPTCSTHRGVYLVQGGVWLTHSTTKPCGSNWGTGPLPEGPQGMAQHKASPGNC